MTSTRDAVNSTRMLQMPSERMKQTFGLEHSSCDFFSHRRGSYHAPIGALCRFGGRSSGDRFKPST